MHIFRKCNLKYLISWKCLQTSFSHRSHYFDKICRNACLKSSFALLPPFLFPTGTLFPRVHFSHRYTFPTGTLKGSTLKNRQLPMWQVTFLVSIFQIFRMVASVPDILDAFNSNICLVFSVSIIAQGSSILKKMLSIPRVLLNSLFPAWNEEMHTPLTLFDFIGVDIDECSNSPCKNQGTCVNTIGGFRCTCPQGFKGDLCDEGTW